MDIGAEREHLLQLAREIEENTNASLMRRDSLLIAAVLDTADAFIPADAVFAGDFSHLDMMKQIIKERVEREEVLLGANVSLKPHFEAHEIRSYTGRYDFGHTAPDWENVYRLGLPGLLKRLEDALENATSDAEREYCEAGICAWRAAVEYVRRMGEKANVLGKTEMGKGLLVLAERPPKGLFEAMQLAFVFYGLQQHAEHTIVRTLGRLDRLLEPFLRADLECGRLTLADAERLVDAFLIEWDKQKITANLPFTLCGKDENGDPYVSECSYLLLRRHTALKLPNVKVHILYSPDLPKDFLQIALNGIRNGGNSIVFLNDKGVIGSLSALGMDHEDARFYDVVGCYEPCAHGEVPCSCNGRVNLAKAVELAMEDCLESDLDTFSFETLLTAFYKHLEALCKGSMAMVDAWEERNARLHSAPFFSSTLDSCIEKRSDVYAGNGAKYHNSSINLLGLATAVDSLLAIRKAVIEDRILTLAELAAILRSNWQGNETLRQRILKKYPKYGLGNADADLQAQEIIKRASEYVNRKPNRKGGIYRLGAFSIDWRIGFGKRMGASADGRRAGEPLSKNLCASVGANRDGVTAEILSAASLNGDDIPNGSVLDLVLHASSVDGARGLEALETTLATYMKLGGMAIQYSVLDAEELRRAQLHPEAYSNLQVRLCGWNARFVSLSKVEQDEFILQAEAR